MNILTRDDTDHATEYVTRAEAEAEIQAALDQSTALRSSVRDFITANGHLADGEVCTLAPLKRLIGYIDPPPDEF